jgi:hypothetical protein
MGTLWEVNLSDFLLVTVLLGGGAAYMTGRAVAHSWRPLPQLLFYLAVLNCGVRFIHYALFGGTLLSVQYFAVDLVILLVIGGIGFRLSKASQIVSQYSWLYDRQSPFSWRERSAPKGP